MEIPDGRVTMREFLRFARKLPTNMPVTAFRVQSDASCVIVDKSGAALVRDDEGGPMVLIVSLD